MLKLYIYGYLHRVQSSRRLEREAVGGAGRDPADLGGEGMAPPMTLMDCPSLRNG
jgi:hypothetical protein